MTYHVNYHLNSVPSFLICLSILLQNLPLNLWNEVPLLFYLNLLHVFSAMITPFVISESFMALCKFS